MRSFSRSSKRFLLVVVAIIMSFELLKVMALECQGTCPISSRSLLFKHLSRSPNTPLARHQNTLAKREKSKKHVSRIAAIHRHNIHHHKSSAHKKAALMKISRETEVKTNSDPSHDTDPYSSLTGSKALQSLSAVTSLCGASNPTSTVTKSSGPNGNEEFFNCGITGSGWAPAQVTMHMIKTVSLEDKSAQSTFAPCQKFRKLFEKYGEQYQIPPIFLAAFAMQESSCQADVKGDNGGAFGLMQITQDKCGDAPGGDCANPDYNVKIGAKTFADGLSNANGNVLIALGGYNGWSEGLTQAKALAAKAEGCCVCQQNLDYLQQFLNGWVLGVNPYKHGLGTVRNLDSCSE